MKMSFYFTFSRNYRSPAAQKPLQNRSTLISLLPKPQVLTMDAELNSEEMENGYDTEFTLAEIMEMKSLYNKMDEESLNLQFYQEIAAKFNNSVHRRGKSVVKWEQVQHWLQELRNRELETEVPSSHRKVEESVGPASMMLDQSPAEVDVQLPNEGLSLAIQRYQKTRVVAAAELSDLLFEARSTRDLAWYDVGAFLNYRVMSSGEIEVRVRFAGFGKDHDEWVNLKRSVRERSIPLENSECERVQVGDVVMCFRENEDLALYCDARIINIHRNVHDESEGCTCVFVVRFDYDYFEGQVRLNNICVRPT